MKIITQDNLILIFFKQILSVIACKLTKGLVKDKLMSQKNLFMKIQAFILR